MVKQVKVSGGLGTLKMVPLAELKPHPRNPNTHSDEQIRLLAKIIEHTGWRHPIVVSNLSGYIMAGHARLKAAQLLGLAEAPVDYQDWASEAEELADLVADNRIAELAERDGPVLKDLLQDMDTGALDMELTGYNADALQDLMTQVHQPESKGGEQGPVITTCPRCGFEYELGGIT